MTSSAYLKNFSVIFSLPASLILFIVTACDTQIKFNEVSKESGIDFSYTFGDTTYENILESSGSGVTILDYDGDNNMDVYLLNGTYLEGISDSEGKIFRNTSNQLYHNNGDGTFTETSFQAGLADKHWSMAAGAVDYDHDGDVDLYVLNYGPNVFFRNNGDGTFSDITLQLGLQGPEKLNGFTKWSVGVAFWDYDQNGRLDMMVGNFLAFDPAYRSPTAPELMPHPSEYKGQASLFYEQQPDGTFKDITQQLGLYFPDSKCMGLTVFDYDNDADLDLFQANDHQANFMFENNGKQIFEEKGLKAGVALNSRGLTTGSMQGTTGDMDGDGLIDLLVTDLEFGALYRNLGKGIYEDITEHSGIAVAFAGKGQWGAALFDYDNDGDLDIFCANGTAEELKLQLPLLLQNDGKGNFKNVGFYNGVYFKEKRSGRGVAVWDYDNDGDRDIIVSHVDLQATPALLRNDGGNKNNWLGITLVSKHGQAGAIGAKVIVNAGTLKQTLINQWATSYLSSNDPRMHAGLGKERVVNSLEIYWPDGTIDVLENINVNQYITVRQEKGIIR